MEASAMFVAVASMKEGSLLVGTVRCLQAHTSLFPRQAMAALPSLLQEPNRQSVQQNAASGD